MHHFFTLWNLYTGLSYYEVATAAGEEVQPKSPLESGNFVMEIYILKIVRKKQGRK